MKNLNLFALSIGLSLSVPFMHAEDAKSLPRATPESQGISSTDIQNFVETLDAKVEEVHSVMIVRHGKVVAEGWWAPYGPDFPHTLYSLTKSFTSTAVGIAVDEGLLTTDDRVLSFFPEKAPADPSDYLKRLRVRDLLTMTTGQEARVMDVLRAREDGDMVKAFFGVYIDYEPGVHFRYNSGASYMLCAIVQKVTGMTVEEYLQPRLYEPLGITKAVWEKSPEGIELGAGGLSVTTEEIAKFGQLYLQKGIYNGKRIVSEKWVNLASDRQTSTGSGSGNWDHGYGYQFWGSKHGYRGDGSLGQFCLILPEQDMVVAVTSGTSNMSDIMDAVWDKLLPALRFTALPENEDGVESLKDSLSSLALPMVEGESTSALAQNFSGSTYVFEENEQSIASVSVDFSNRHPVVVFRDKLGEHEIKCGLIEGLEGDTVFQSDIGLLSGNVQKVLTTSAWTAPDTFVLKLRFFETPYETTMTFKFEENRLSFDTVHNVRWGPTVRPQIVGVRNSE